MFKFLNNKYWFNFYLPSELFLSIGSIDRKSLELIFKNRMLNFKRIILEEVSNNLFYVSISFEKEKDFNSFKKYISEFKELIPPWTAFPDLFQGVPRWNQGFQEDYCINNWIPFWNRLNELEKIQYLKKYNCPNDWHEWLTNNNMN